MKKTAGIFLIFSGSCMYLLCGYGFLSYSMRTKEEIAANYTKQGIDPERLFDGGLDNHIKKGKTVIGIITVIGAGIAFGGYKLYKKG